MRNAISISEIQIARNWFGCSPFIMECSPCVCRRWWLYTMPIWQGIRTMTCAISATSCLPWQRVTLVDINSWVSSINSITINMWLQKLKYQSETSNHITTCCYISIVHLIWHLLFHLIYIVMHCWCLIFSFISRCSQASYQVNSYDWHHDAMQDYIFNCYK